MAYLILEDGAGGRIRDGGYYDFDPKNGNDIEMIRTMIAHHAHNSRPVTLLCAAGEANDNILLDMIGKLRALWKNRGNYRNMRRHRAVRPLPHKTTIRMNAIGQTPDRSMV